MNEREIVQRQAEEADSLAEFLELADAPLRILAEEFIEYGWQRDIPRARAVEILRREQRQLNQYQTISLSQSSRAPRYTDLSDLELVDGNEFEHILAELLTRIEGEAIVTEASGDKGVDVVWSKDDSTIGVQAKAYSKNNVVGISAVQEIHTGSVVRKSEFQIDTPAVVTTSRYSQEAEEAAEKSGVILYGRDQLRQWLSEAELDSEALGDVLGRLD
ncbi:hypothetical protein AUR64_04035 [Haloprofundus marisrubri]|uniref:Restriction endonuclease type IV Mrr domain-containing protein n=1 Tax=Haloprofundus marisrubri TaxID=1514971 RepID=A0A0W1RDD3_9EURY|nr:restriction endonuclease [Haloprofundus marisrubri]KTG11432.1 hypothetical protein AUR64_04035 [Haloprofundus marisrubri]